MNIAVYTHTDFQSDYAEALQAHHVEFVDINTNLLSALRSYDQKRFDRFVIMDDSTTDKIILDTLRQFIEGERADKSNMEPVFIANAFRPSPSMFYTVLIKNLGIYQIIAKSQEEDYDFYAELVRSLYYPLRRSDVSRLCLSEKSEQNQSIQSFASQPSMNGTGLIDYRKTVRIAFCQGARRNGSTHLTLACARALTLMNYRVAVAIKKDHFQEIRRSYPRASYNSELSFVALAGIHLYETYVPTMIPDNYDYVLSDLGEALWLGVNKNDPKIQENLRKQELAKKVHDIYHQADFRVFSTFVAPTGIWEFGMEQIKKMGKRDLSNSTFAVFGIPNEDVKDKLCARLYEFSEHARLVSIPPILGPLFVRNEDEINPSIYELLYPVLKPKHRQKIGSVEPAASTSEQKKTSFLGKLLNRGERDE